MRYEITEEYFKGSVEVIGDDTGVQVNVEPDNMCKFRIIVDQDMTIRVIEHATSKVLYSYGHQGKEEVEYAREEEQSPLK